MNNPRVVVGITGASGAIYARRMIDVLERAGVDVHVTATPYGKRLLNDELNVRELSATALIGRESDRVIVHACGDLGAAISSGSFLTHGMVIAPCSSHSLAAVATGLCDNLVLRAAHVHLKERRPLIVIARETPLSRIELQNMLKLDEAGATIMPASPGFYLKPASIDDLVDFVVARAVDLLGIKHDLNVRWVD